jgi:hypothetical protein
MDRASTAYAATDAAVASAFLYASSTPPLLRPCRRRRRRRRRRGGGHQWQVIHGYLATYLTNEHKTAMTNVTSIL